MMAGIVHLTLRESLGSGAVVLVGLLLLASACTVAPGDSGAAGSIAVVEAMGGGGAEGFARATEVRDFSFPDDHGPHEDFRTEWWYFTGNLETDDGEAFGVQVTIFRHALEPRLPQRSSLWASRDVWFAHLAVGDATRGSFAAAERFERGAMGLAGARSDPFAAWVGDWRLESVEESETFPMRLVASADEIAIDLIVAPEKPIVFQGDRGLSQKGPEPGNASYYYSVTRLSASGSLIVDGEVVSVNGSAWFDREWSTSALSEGQDGWDWFSIQLEDGRDLMLYRMRRADGATDPHNSGLMIAADGTTQRLGPDAVSYEPGRQWTSPRSGASYPVEWRLRIEPLDIELDVTPMLDESELDLAVRYWEGAIRVRGNQGNQPIGGRGFLEMSGYANPRPVGESAPAR
jgi:predicted secreted hydrolase